MNLVSIIIPIYNIEQYLDECLNSVLNQTYKNIEVILVDDGSKDNSKKICKKYCNLDNRFKYYYQKNSGASKARSNGLDKSNGEYIFFLDSDDFITNDAIEILVNGLKKNDLILCGRYNYYKNRIDKRNIKNRVIDNKQAMYELIATTKFSGFITDKLFKKSIIDKYNINFDSNIKIGEDLLFCYKYLEKCNKVKCIDKMLYYYRFRKSSLLNKDFKNDSSLLDTIKYVINNTKDEKLKEISKQKYIEVYNNISKYNIVNTDYYNLLNKQLNYKTKNNIFKTIRIKLVYFARKIIYKYYE